MSTQIFLAYFLNFVYQTEQNKLSETEYTYYTFKNTV